MAQGSTIVEAGTGTPDCARFFLPGDLNINTAPRETPHSLLTMDEAL